MHSLQATTRSRPPAPTQKGKPIKKCLALELANQIACKNLELVNLFCIPAMHT